MAARKFGTKNREGREKGISKLMSENMAKEKWTTGNLVKKWYSRKKGNRTLMSRRNGNRKIIQW